MAAKVTISKDIETHDYNRASANHECSNWNHMIVLDPNDGTVDVCTMFGNGTPMPIWEYRAFVLFRVADGTADVSNLVECLQDEDTISSLQAIVNGYSEEFDGSNWRGDLTEDAEHTKEYVSIRLEQFCSDMPMYWDANDWYEPMSFRDIGKLAHDEDRESILDSEVNDALINGAHLDRNDLDSYLDGVKDETCPKCFEDNCECDDEEE